MSDEVEKKTVSEVEQTIVSGDVIERRSIDPDTVFQAMEATGILTGGFGTLALGASKLKETFGGGQETPQRQAPSGSTKKED
jgi:hypothetical protein